MAARNRRNQHEDDDDLASVEWFNHHDNPTQDQPQQPIVVVSGAAVVNEQLEAQQYQEFQQLQSTLNMLMAEEGLQAATADVVVDAHVLAVVDEEEEEVDDNNESDDVSSSMKKKFRMTASLVCVLMTMTVAIVVAAFVGTQGSSGGGGDAGMGASSTTPTMAPTPILVTSFPAPTAISPPLSPSIPGSLPTKNCFARLGELEQAVDEYLEDSSNSSTVAMTYGWPIGSSCVSPVRSFFELFSAERNPKAALFDESLNDWDTSSVQDMAATFQGAAAFNPGFAPCLTCFKMPPPSTVPFPTGMYHLY